jgi:hypothetical protein
MIDLRRHSHDQIQLAPQPLDQVLSAGTMIRINDRNHGEHAGVRQDVEVNGCISAFGDGDWYSCADWMSAKDHQLCRAADMRDERVKSVLVVHIEAVYAEPSQQPEQAAKNRDRRWAGRSRFVVMDRRFNLGKPYANITTGGDIDEHGAHEIAHCRSAVRAAT